MNFAVIKAGGTGNRFHSKIPKQFTKINGKTLLEYSVDNIIASARFDKIVISCLKSYIDYVKKLYQNNNSVIVIEGGSSGLYSIINAIDYLKPKLKDYIFIHEANRPFLTTKSINAVLKYARIHKFCISAKPIYERMFGLSNGSIAVPNFDNHANQLVIFTHPEVYEYSYLKFILQSTESFSNLFDGFSSPLDLLKILNINSIPIFNIEFNIKITTKADLLFVKHLI